MCLTHAATDFGSNIMSEVGRHSSYEILKEQVGTCWSYYRESMCMHVKQRNEMKSIPVSVRQPTCKAQNAHFYCSDGNTFFIEVVPMGVYYNISKFEPHWISFETSGLPTPSLVQKTRFCSTTKRRPHGLAAKGSHNWSPLIPCEESLRCSKRSMGWDWFQPH